MYVYVCDYDDNKLFCHLRNELGRKDALSRIWRCYVSLHVLWSIRFAVHGVGIRMALLHDVGGCM